jgi:hypothetical protein
MDFSQCEDDEQQDRNGYYDGLFPALLCFRRAETISSVSILGCLHTISVHNTLSEEGEHFKKSDRGGPEKGGNKLGTESSASFGQKKAARSGLL